MRIDIPANETWYAASERLRTQLPFLDPAVQVQVYAGHQHALFESAQGLARLFSHKKTVAVIEPLEPAIEAIATGFSEDAYTVKRLRQSDLDNPSAWFDPIASDLIFVLGAEDDPVSGRRYDLSKLDASLKDKRVFRLKLSHASFREPGRLTRPEMFEVRIISLRHDLAAIVAGERFRAIPLLSPRLAWNSAQISDAGFISEADFKSRSQAVLSFESRLPTVFKPYFAPGDARVFDRAVFFAPDLDGSAVIDEVANILRLSVPGPGLNSVLEATSPCRWRHPRFADWLIARGERSETVRGLIAIAAENLGEPMRAALEEAARNIRAK